MNAQDITEPLTSAEVAKRLASARNYAYEATMGDYSAASIERAQDSLAYWTEKAQEMDLDVDSLLVRGQWGWKVAQ